MLLVAEGVCGKGMLMAMHCPAMRRDSDEDGRREGIGRDGREWDLFARTDIVSYCCVIDCKHQDRQGRMYLGSASKERKMKKGNIYQEKETGIEE